MKRTLEYELERLRADYQRIIGRPFDHFFCPFLFKDENVPICQGHIINIAFSNSSRRCIVQRKDIDNFYGRYFEADFVDLEYTSKLAPPEILGNKKLSKKFKPKITLNDKVCDYYLQNGPIPYNHTRMDITDGHKTIPIVLKINPLSVVSEKTHNIDFEVYKDLRVAALVSLIKSAHLTLFDLIGYQYALSAGGHFVGKNILGEFFLQNAEKSKQEVIENATAYFRKFKNMVRPAKTTSSGFKGTIYDKKILFCNGASNSLWAMIIFIKTSYILHAVLVPIIDQAEAANRYFNFLEDQQEFIEVNECCYKERIWQIAPEIRRLYWPKQGILFP